MKRARRISLFDILNMLLMAAIILVTLYPFLNLAATSVSEPAAVAARKVTFYPIGFQTASYRTVLGEPLFWSGYLNTVIFTVSGTAISIIMTTLCAYVVSRRKLPGRKVIMMFFVVSMFVQGGMIPTYLVVRTLGLIDSLWAIVLPNAISTYYMIIMRTYFMGIPDSLEEAAMIDGMRPTGILFRIFLPVSTPVIATIVLFYAVNKWNMWFKPLLYLNKPEMYPVTLFLRNIVFSSQLALKDSVDVASESSKIYMTIKATAILLVVAPIMAVYPFIQKYFVKGVMIGSLKE